MTLHRRLFVLSGLGVGVAATSAQAAPRGPTQPALIPDTGADQTANLQSAIDDAAARGVPLELPAGVFKVGAVALRAGSVVTGAAGLTTLQSSGTGAFITATKAAGIGLSQLTLDGQHHPLDPARSTALLAVDGCPDIDLSALSIKNSSGNGVSITRSTGRVTGCTVSAIANAGLFSLDSTLTISGNSLSGCGNNGILIWRSQPGADGSQVSANRIFAIRADGGGSGQNGNGINVFRAGNVQVSGNMISDCAYSAIRGNAASNIAMTGNTCQRSGEVALYAEFAFEGALIANNIVDGAAAGISITNFNDGGRLAVVQGNLIRNLVRREFEPVDKRGHGITVEADSLVTGNTIESAATCGILLGWGRYMRDVSATGNLIRGCRIGILVSSDATAGRALVTANLISGSTDGAIRAHDQGRAFGPDLALATATSGRVMISGNSAA